MMVSLAVRITIASSTSSGSVEDTLNTTAHKIFKGDITTAKEFRKEIDSIVPSNEKFKAAFSTGEANRLWLATYLRSLERAAKEEPTPWYSQ